MHISPDDPENDWKAVLKLAVLHDEHISVADLQEILLDYGFDPTTFTISGARASFRHDLKVLRHRGVLGEIDRTKLPPIRTRRRKLDRASRAFTMKSEAALRPSP